MILALDVGGTKLAAARVEGGRVLERLEAPTPTHDRGPEAVTRAALELLRPLLPGARALGVAATGGVAGGKVTALNADTLQGWHAYDLQGALQGATGLPTAVVNDADAAAWGEAAYGAGQGVENFIFVTVSTGVGSGLVLGGRLYLSRHGLHAEMGYMRAPDGTPLELVASGGALDRWARGRGWEGAREVVRRAAADPAAEAKLAESAGLVADKLADLKVMLGLERAVIGGGLGLSAGYLERVRAALGRLDPLYALEVLPAALGADAGLIGAADWAGRTSQ
ncbi:N-acetylmannosamine kinase [Calidithermus terrae]|uniref:N-acetylmannosamine kinase n=1 Tax=Calidithermus terrae TaxID=1408545 RepID=A0A399ECR5_9DEIN|nr:ROK family protein [Calidithermus terrae]RIH79942.1 N-acetylmannosamine kinase [Calidithermus terrae]